VTELPPPEVIERGLEAIADVLRREHPGCLVTIEPAPDDLDAVVDRRASAADVDAVDHRA
jgi:hypothetical protein